MDTKPTLLVVDDDPEIGTLLEDYFQRHHYKVIIAEDGKQMATALEEHQVNLVILDIMLPGDDGITLCKKLREHSNIPIIMLSAIGEESDRVIGLEIGADDYIPKPFSPRELLARIKALLRRSYGDIAEDRKDITQVATIRFGNWTLDRNKRRLISPDNITVPLSSGEFNLLLVFIENQGKPLTRDQLMDLTYGREATPFDRSIDVQVARLRKKIETDPKKPQVIATVRGCGYRFDPKINKENQHE